MLGFVGFIGQIPFLFLSPIGGALADRFCRKRLMIAIQIIAMLQALALVFLQRTNSASVVTLSILLLILGVVSSIETPVRQSLLKSMVGKEHLRSAISFYSMLAMASRFVGPSIGGVVIAWFGETLCFEINAASYIGILLVFIYMDLERDADHIRNTKFLHIFVDGFKYVKDSIPVRKLLILVAGVSICGSYIQLLPVVVNELKFGGSEALGMLMGAVGLGGAVGAGYLATTENSFRLSSVPVFASIVLASSMILFSISGWFWLSIILMFCFGSFSTIAWSSSNILIQSIVPDEKRGSVISYYSVALVGMAPIGSLISGALASQFGATKAFLINGITLFIIVYVQSGSSMLERKNADLT